MHSATKLFLSGFLLTLLLGSNSVVFAQTKDAEAVEPDLPPRGGTVPIPDDGYDGSLGSMACTASNVADTGNVEDVEFEVALEHTWVGDLTIKLVSPAGTVATVQSRAGLAEPADDGTDCCGNSDNLALGSPITYSTTNGVVDAETMGGTDTSNVVCQDDGECSFVPNPGSAADSGDLSALFDGEAANGDWEVCVGDSGGLDTGNLGAATVTVVTGGGGGPGPGPGEATAVPALSRTGLILLGLVVVLVAGGLLYRGIR